MHTHRHDPAHTYSLRRKLCPLILTLSLGMSGVVQAEEPVLPSFVDPSVEKEAEHSIEIGLKWLSSTQEDNGSWYHHPGITSLVVTAFLKSPAGYTEWNNETVARAVQFLLSCVQPDGGIYVKEMPGYNTSVAIMAFVATQNPDYTQLIRNARDFLIDLQIDEEEGYTRDHPFYGGIGYGGDNRPDMSNMQWALEALKVSAPQRPHLESSDVFVEYSREGGTASASDTTSKELFWEKAILFLQRCQNLKSTNDQAWASDDGGFVYYPGSSKAGGTTSYGGMTYGGMRSFIHAGLSRDDPRVQAAYGWIQNNYTLDENPELGAQGLYYYYHSVAKALGAYGEEILTDADGVDHRWREEFIEKLVSIQSGEGYWVNENGRWWENNKELVTAYCVLALERAAWNR